LRLGAPSAFPTLKPRRYRASSVDPEATPPGASFELSCPSASDNPGNPVFRFPFRRSARRDATPLRRSHPQGLATLSVASAPRALRAFSSSPRSWASPYEALLLPGDRKNVSIPSLRSRASTRNLIGLGSAPQRFPPAVKAVPLRAAGWIRPGRGPCFLGPSGLPGSPSPVCIRKASLLPDHPRGVSSSHLSRSGVTPPSGPYQTEARRFPLQDADLPGLPADGPRTLFEPEVPRGLFFHLRTPGPLARPERSFFAGDPDSPFGRA